MKLPITKLIIPSNPAVLKAWYAGVSLESQGKGVEVWRVVVWRVHFGANCVGSKMRLLYNP